MDKTQYKGTVIKSTGSWYQVLTQENTIYDCRIKGKFRLKDIQTTNPVAVGDKVAFNIEEDNTGTITSITDRKNYIIRKSVNLSKKAHIIASNIDVAFLVVTLFNPKTFLSFIDRFLVSAEAYHIPAVLLFNKIDTLTKEELKETDEVIAIYKKIGYKCIKISAETGENLDQVQTLMQNKISVFSGHSGVGKSSIINKLDRNLNIKTGEISEQHKQGKHTTTFAEMHPLHFGGFIIDTPGIRGLGLVDIEKTELTHFFPEFKILQPQCKFSNCVHINEPKCAVKEALQKGKINESRYNSYFSMYHEDENNRIRENLYGPK